MKTVYDLMRHHTALEVICANCPNTAVLNNRFLSRHYGMMKVITELRFVCRRCRSQHYRLRASGYTMPNAMMARITAERLAQHLQPSGYRRDHVLLASYFPDCPAVAAFSDGLPLTSLVL